MINNVSIVVDLDSILDVRLSILNRLLTDKDKFNKVLLTYTDRKQDIFEYIDDFHLIYDKRNKSDLKDVTVSNMIFFIDDHIKKYLKESAKGPNQYIPTLYVNVNPFSFEDDEKTIFKDFLESLFENKFDTQIIDKSIKELSPLFLKSINTTSMFLYRYVDWIDFHYNEKSFDKHPCSDIKLFSPKIYFTKPDKNEEISDDPFTAMKIISSIFVDIDFLEINNYNSFMLENSSIKK